MLEYLEFVDDVVDELESRAEVDYVQTMLEQRQRRRPPARRCSTRLGDLKKVVEYMVAETQAGL